MVRQQLHEDRKNVFIHFSRAVLHASDISSGPDSIIMASSAEKVVSPRTAKKLREFEEYINDHTFDTIDDMFEFISNKNRADQAKDQAVYPQPSLDKCEPQRVPEPNQGRPVLVPEEARSVATQAQYSKGFKEEIAQNAKKWMTEEECDYELDKLCNQCFNVENYNHILHHFNFTVKKKTAGSTDWISVLYFAEVKEILGPAVELSIAVGSGRQLSGNALPERTYGEDTSPEVFRRNGVGSAGYLVKGFSDAHLVTGTRVAVMGTVFCPYVVTGIVSLRYLSVSSNQAICATMPFFTAVLAYTVTTMTE
ncbi:hypothetical protein PR202_ga30129 [Eleusine coracana subsp. coracana]|uniref:DUF3615 domain-containing protein n=1 Tax=Eleusine coracana subsp. coracana TaxID=191504 RepID=A0AAV5DLH0_ELECO|nr:hypothetical protein PR202_ga30129 [Eleusine coracana subsp. coracana]